MSRRFPNNVRRLIHERSGGLCELDGCGEAVQIHHRAPAGIGGVGVKNDWVNKAANGLHVALRCHYRAEGRAPFSRRQSRDNGWLVDRNGIREADEVPLLYRGSLVLLTDDGRVLSAHDGTVRALPGEVA